MHFADPVSPGSQTPTHPVSAESNRTLPLGSLTRHPSFLFMDLLASCSTCPFSIHAPPEPSLWHFDVSFTPPAPFSSGNKLISGRRKEILLEMLFSLPCSHPRMHCYSLTFPLVLCGRSLTFYFYGDFPAYLTPSFQPDSPPEEGIQSKPSPDSYAQVQAMQGRGHCSGKRVSCSASSFCTHQHGP